MKRLPRKKKKALKKRDPELYRFMHVCSRIKDVAIKVSREFGNIMVAIDSVGGTIGSAKELQTKLQ